MQNVFVFDIDDTLARILDDDKTVDLLDRDMGEDFRVRHTVLAMGYPHMVFPGFYALFNWIHQRGDLIRFFSTGTQERNDELVKAVMDIAFGDKSEEVLKTVKVFSRQDAIDTHLMGHEEGEMYQPLTKHGRLYGRRKKKLEGVVVDCAQLPWTLLIDDDASYMTRGEEENFLVVAHGDSYYQGNTDRQDFNGFHKACYIRGALEVILGSVVSRGITLIQAASDFKATFDGIGYRERDNAILPYYESGLKLLREFEPELKFHFGPN